MQTFPQSTGGMGVRLQQNTERKTHCESLASGGESVDAPTVGSTPERLCQQQRHTFGMQKEYRVSENTNSFRREDDENDANAIEMKDLQICDSLEVDAHPCSKASPTHPLQADATEIKSGTAGESKTVSENVSSELCHEPNMTRSPSGDGSLSPQLATEAYYIVPQGRQSHTEHMAGTDSVLLAPSHVSADKSDRPRDVARRCADIDDPRTPDVCSGNQSNVTSHAGFRRDSERDGHPEVGEPCSEQGDNSPESNVHQQPGVTASKKLERQEDIVARNKMTLGRNAFPGGSYTMAYAHKQGRAHNGKQVGQICREKKGQRKESPSVPLQKQQPSALGVTGREQGHTVNPPSEGPAAVSQPKAPRTTSLPPNCPPSVSKPAHLVPLVERRAQINPACSYLGPAAVAERTLLPGHQETHHEKFNQIGRVHQGSAVTSPVRGHRITATTWTSPSEGDEHKWILDEFQCGPSPQRPPRTPTSPASLSLGPDTYSVLPPVGKPATGEEPELSPGQSANTADSIHSSSSSSSSQSYLAQMGKHKQLGATYKAYTLKDYNQLQCNVTLRGLGPDYTAVEEAAEKMRRQRLYSNVIREQNKKISRIPFLPAKNLQGADRKVPRIKALEYAKTIVKPCAQAHVKPRQQGHWKDYEGQTPPSKGLDSFPPDTLAALLKRHEEEKKATAQSVRAVSS